MNKIEVTFPSSDPSCQLSGDLALPSSDDDTKLLPVIVIVAGSGVSIDAFALLGAATASCAFPKIPCLGSTHSR